MSCSSVTYNFIVLLKELIFYTLDHLWWWFSGNGATSVKRKRFFCSSVRWIRLFVQMFRVKKMSAEFFFRKKNSHPEGYNGRASICGPMIDFQSLFKMLTVYATPTKFYTWDHTSSHKYFYQLDGYYTRINATLLHTFVAHKTSFHSIFIKQSHICLTQRAFIIKPFPWLGAKLIPDVCHWKYIKFKENKFSCSAFTYKISNISQLKK